MDVAKLGQAECYLIRGYLALQENNLQKALENIKNARAIVSDLFKTTVVRLEWEKVAEWLGEDWSI